MIKIAKSYKVIAMLEDQPLGASKVISTPTTLKCGKSTAKVKPDGSWVLNWVEGKYKESYTFKTEADFDKEKKVQLGHWKDWVGLYKKKEITKEDLAGAKEDFDDMLSVMAEIKKVLAASHLGKSLTPADRERLVNQLVVCYKKILGYRNIDC